jgi:O-antigen ligase
LCAVALAYPILLFSRKGKIGQALLLSAIVLALFANMAFVNVSRTAMVTMPVMLAAFALLHLRARTSVTIFCVAAILVGLAFAASPQLHNRASLSLRDYQLYMESDIPTSPGLRLEYWRKSLRFFAEAPLAGHGTGSTREKGYKKMTLWTQSVLVAARGICQAAGFHRVKEEPHHSFGVGLVGET